MKKKILILAIFLLGISSFSYFAYCQDQSLRLTIKSDKEAYEIGDTVTINCKVENVSDKVVSFYKAYRPEITFDVNTLDKEICPTLDAPQTGDSISLISLKPKEHLQYSITGKIIKGEGKLFIGGSSKADAKFREVKGIFLEAPGKGKVYLKNGFVRYELMACYKDGSGWAMPPASDYIVGDRVVYPKEVLEKFKDKWQGTLISNTIQIEVAERELIAKARAIAEAYLSGQPFKDYYDKIAYQIKEDESYVYVYFHAKGFEDPPFGLVRVNKKILQPYWIPQE